jgi:hypothetical protein
MSRSSQNTGLREFRPTREWNYFSTMPSGMRSRAGTFMDMPPKLFASMLEATKPQERAELVRELRDLIGDLRALADSVSDFKPKKLR